MNEGEGMFCEKMVWRVFLRKKVEKVKGDVRGDL